jgi:hypothetical protein
MIAKHIPQVPIDRDMRYSWKDAPEKVYAYSMGTWYDNTTPTEVIRVLEYSRKNDIRIRIFQGDRDTGRDWLCEWDVAGRVGRSTGPMQIPLLIHNSRSMGGGHIMDHCIIKITYALGGELLYKQANYHHMPMAARISDLPEYEVAVWVKNHEPDGGEQIHARFRTIREYQRWEKKMQLTIAPEIFVQRAYLEQGLPYEVKAL